MPPTSRFRIATALLIIVLALVAVSTSASATAEHDDHDASNPAPRFETRVDALATGVVEGEIIGQRYITTTGGAVTETAVRVTDWHRGAGPNVITVVSEGGVTSNGLIHNVSHQPALDVGSNVQLALLDEGPTSLGQSFTVVGGTAGALDAATGKSVGARIINSAELEPAFVLNGDAWVYPLAAPTDFKLIWNAPDMAGDDEATAINTAVASWETVSGIDFTNTGSSSLSVADPNDFVNVVFWADTPNPAHTFLAKASWYEYVNAPGEIVGFDVHFNTDHAWSMNPASGHFDIQSVALHEIGHSIGLDHTTDSADVMFSSLRPAVLQRTLSTGDIAGAQELYPEAIELQHRCVGSVATIVGTAGADTLIGTSGRDVFVGLGGDDTIHGYGGNDLVCSGSGHDTVFGGSGNDIVYGQTGSDSLRGGLGNDELFGGPGYDDLHGDAGNDRLQAAGGNDTLRGGDGNDVLWGKPGNDLLYGDDGDDEIYAASGDDIAYGGAGRDSIQGAGGDDELHGGADHDILFGQNNNDELFGDAGNDTIYAAAGDDRLDGGSGDDNLQGGGGNDAIYAAAGNDILYGQSGTNRLNGGAGIDRCFAGGTGSTVTSC